MYYNIDVLIKKERGILLKEEALSFIKGFSDITITSICLEHKINRSNLLNGLSSVENTILVKNEIIKKFKELEKRYIMNYLLFVFTEFYENEEYDCSLDNELFTFSSSDEIVSFLKKRDLRFLKEGSRVYSDAFCIYRIDDKVCLDDLKEIDLSTLDEIYSFCVDVKKKLKDYQENDVNFQLAYKEELSIAFEEICKLDNEDKLKDE